jgi:hypothetical protein
MRIAMVFQGCGVSPAPGEVAERHVGELPVGAGVGVSVVTVDEIAP